MAYGLEPGSPDYWLGRLMRRLGDRQARYDRLERYALGLHPLPDGDRRYVKALRDLQRKSQTNYISLVLKAVTQRMRFKAFKFEGRVDEEAKRVWRANDMELQSAQSISQAAIYGESYALVSPPDETSNGIPVITIEDPRCCIVEHDPVRPLRRLAGLKLYRDDLIGHLVAVLYLPEETLVYLGPKLGEKTEDEDPRRLADRIMHHGSAAAGFELAEVHPNEIGEVPLICGRWQPETGLAECEDGAFEIQDRINHTMLARLIITKSQAYRQRMIAGAKIPKNGASKTKAPFDPGADMIWVVEDSQAKVFDLEQADIKQLLEAIRDDVGDLAAVTQTPITYLTNKIANVNASTLNAVEHSHIAKVRRRMDAMGWYFEAIMKLCFRYMGNSKADDVEAEVQWHDPEVRTFAEMGDLAAKFASAEIPMELVMERLGFTPEEVAYAKEEMERRRREDAQMQMELAEKMAMNRGMPGQGTSFGGGSKSGGSSSNSKSGSTKQRRRGTQTDSGSTQQASSNTALKKPAAQKPAADKPAR